MKGLCAELFIRFGAGISLGILIKGVANFLDIPVPWWLALLIGVSLIFVAGMLKVSNEESLNTCNTIL